MNLPVVKIKTAIASTKTILIIRDTLNTVKYLYLEIIATAHLI